VVVERGVTGDRPDRVGKLGVPVGIVGGEDDGLITEPGERVAEVSFRPRVPWTISFSRGYEPPIHSASSVYAAERLEEFIEKHLAGRPA